MRVFALCLLLALPVVALDDNIPLPDRARQYLIDLLKLDTTNPPGNETRVAEYLRQVADAHGISCELLGPDARRLNFVARLKGGVRRRPLLLIAHSDVVPVDRGQWTVDPFRGETRGGFIFGRGAAAAIVMDGAPGSASALGAREDVDAYDIAGGGTFGGLTVGASYRDVQDVFEQWGVGASFKFGFGLTVAATYSSRDYDTSGVGDPSVWDLIGTYAFGNNVILAGYAQYDFDDNRDNLDAWKLGYQYNLSKRTRVFAEYAAENGFGFTEATQTDRNVFSVGMRHDF